ncbi:unnamed protein product [Discula destructiva]
MPNTFVFEAGVFPAALNPFADDPQLHIDGPILPIANSSSHGEHEFSYRSIEGAVVEFRNNLQHLMTMATFASNAQSGPHTSQDAIPKFIQDVQAMARDIKHMSEVMEQWGEQFVCRASPTKTGPAYNHQLDVDVTQGLDIGGQGSFGAVNHSPQIVQASSSVLDINDDEAAIYHQQVLHTNEDTTTADNASNGDIQPPALTSTARKPKRKSRAPTGRQTRFTKAEDRLICQGFEDGLKKGDTQYSTGVYLAGIFNQNGRTVTDEAIKHRHWRMRTSYKNCRMPEKVNGRFLLD